MVRIRVGSRRKRGTDRFRVHLPLRTGGEEARAFAENLSRGGLFIRGGAGLGVGDSLVIAIDLPGHGEFAVGVSVAHVITAEMAREHGRSAGVGLELCDTSREFEEALAAYLSRLGRRGDRMILTTDEGVHMRLCAAGYQARMAPPATALAAALRDSPVPVVAVVISPAARREYYAAARAAGAGDLVVALDAAAEVEELLPWLDRDTGDPRT